MDQHATDLLSRPAETEAEAELDADARAWLDLREGVPSVWSRYTNLVVDHGAGSWIESIEGERYLDYTSGIGVVSTGHAHPRVSRAIAEQAAQIIHAQQNILYHKPGLLLHAALPKRFPNLPDGETARLFLSNSGAEAIEAAVKLAKVATHRQVVVAFRGGFHGRTHGTMALTSSGVRIRGHFEPLLGSVLHVPYPNPLRNPTGRSEEAALAFTLDAIEELFATMVYPEDVAAFLVEPILGEGGYVIPPDTFLPALREIADRHGILLIADEVQSGYGRTGRFFATEWTTATPDIVVMAKGIASGMPLSGIMARGDLLDAFGPGSHGGTYGGNAVACAAAVATIEVIDDEGLVANAARQGARLLAGLQRVAGDHRLVAEVRGRGLMLALEFAEPGTLAPRPDLAKALLHEAFDRKLLLLTCGTRAQVVRIIPPLVTTDDEADLAIRVIGESLEAIGA